MSHGSSGRLGLDGDSMATRYSNGNANDMSGDSLRAPERASVTVGTDHFVHRSKNQDDKPTFSAAEKEGADAADAHSVDRSGQKTINLIPDSIVECIPVVAGPGAELSSFLNSSSDEDLSRASDVETVSNVEISDRPDRDSNTDPIYTDISSMPVQTEPAPTNSKDLPALQEVDGVVESYHENPRLDRKTSTGSDESERRDQSAKKKILVKSKQLDIEQDQKKSSHRRSKRKDDPPLTSEDEDTSPALTPAVATYSRLKKPVRRAAPLASAAVSVATSSHDALNEISNYDKQNVVRDAKAALLRVETETEQILADKKSISDHPEDIGHELHAVPSNAVMIISKNNADYSVADSINIDSFREDIMTEELLVDNKDDSNEIKLVKPAVFNACSHPCGSKSLSSDDRHEESITDNIQFDKEAEISEVTDNHISTTDEAHAIGYLPKDIKNEPQVIAFKTPENRSDLLVADSIDIDSFRQDCVPDEFFADSEEDD